jgi:hypothetical protein
MASALATNITATAQTKTSQTFGRPVIIGF